jgi:hypothetical protein
LRQERKNYMDFQIEFVVDTGFNDYLIDRARVTGQTLDETEPRAIKAWYAADTDRIFIELNTEIIMGFPSQRLQGLKDVTPRQLAEVEVMPSGYGLHWESLDVDLGVPELVAGLFGSKA